MGSFGDSNPNWLCRFHSFRARHACRHSGRNHQPRPDWRHEFGLRTNCRWAEAPSRRPHACSGGLARRSITVSPGSNSRASTSPQTRRPSTADDSRNSSSNFRYDIARGARFRTRTARHDSLVTDRCAKRRVDPSNGRPTLDGVLDGVCVNGTVRRRDRRRQTVNAQ